MTSGSHQIVKGNILIENIYIYTYTYIMLPTNQQVECPCAKVQVVVNYSKLYIYIRNSINPKQSSNELDKRFGCSGRFDDVLDEDVKLKEYLNVQVIIYI